MIIVSGVSDYGKSRVVYIAKKLEIKAKEGNQKFFERFPFDSLQKEYFDDYVNFWLYIIRSFSESN